jgi:20S proteasome subunit beta 3
MFYLKDFFFICYRFGPYFVEPVIAGLEPKTFKPYIASMDLIGCPMVTEDFVVSGTCSEQMYGMCESLWEPDLVSIQIIPDTVIFI